MEEEQKCFETKVLQKWMWELVPQSTLGDVGGNSVETADGSIAAELWLRFFFF